MSVFEAKPQAQAQSQVVAPVVTSYDASVPAIKGTGQPGAKVTPSLDDTALTGNTTVASDGTWTFMLSGALAAGSHSITAQQSVISNSGPLTVNVAAPAQTFVAPSMNWRAQCTATYRTTADATFDTAMKAQHTAKSLPQTVVAGGTTEDISVYHPATGAAGQLLYFDYQLATGSAGDPTSFAVFESADSTDGSPGSGTWTANGFAPYRPNSGNAYAGVGQFIRIPPNTPAGWTRLRVVEPSGRSHVFFLGLFQLQVDGTHDLWAMVGMSITSINMPSRPTRAAIQAAVPGSDPIVVCTARPGANLPAIKSEQIDVLRDNAQLSGIRNVWYDGSGVNSLGNNSGGSSDTGAIRPYAQSSAASLTQLQAEIDTNYKELAALPNVQRVWTGNLNGFYSVQGDSARDVAPYTNGDPSSANGFKPFNDNIVDPYIKANLPSSWASAYDTPFVDDSAQDLVDLSYFQDFQHNSTLGAAAWRSNRAPLFRAAYGLAAGDPTIARLLKQVGPVVTQAQKDRANAILAAINPTSDSAATSARAALQAIISGWTVGYTEPVPTSPAIKPSAASTPVLWDINPGDPATISRDWSNGITSQVVDRQNGKVFAQATGNYQPAFRAPGISGEALPDFDFPGALTPGYGSFTTGDSAALAAIDSAQAWAIFCVVKMRGAVPVNDEVVNLSAGGTLRLAINWSYSLVPRLFRKGISGNYLAPADSGLTSNTATVAFMFGQDASGATIYQRGATKVTGAATTEASTTTILRVGSRGNNLTVLGPYLKRLTFFAGLPSSDDITNILAGLRQTYGAI